MFILQENPIDPSHAKHIGTNGSNGAFIHFEGMVRADRHEGKEVASLLYIADVPACVEEGKKILQETHGLFPIHYACCIQRVGTVAVGQTSIWIGVWASHRDEAFKACRHIIEEVKKRLLIWKKEIYTDGTTRWIHGEATKHIQI